MFIVSRNENAFLRMTARRLPAASLSSNVSRSDSAFPSTKNAWLPCSSSIQKSLVSEKIRSCTRYLMGPSFPRLGSLNMEQRTLGRTGRSVSVVGLGTWQLGADWGSVDEQDALAVLAAAVDSGVTFLDTADVYGDGRSERLIGQFLKQRREQLFVATKMGRRVAQEPANY